jgi:SPP1 gp7 family putative phage head morphogenesis protein
MIGLDFKLPPEEQITAAALNPVDRIGWPTRTGNHITAANDAVRQSVYQGIVQGNSYDSVARELRDTLNITASKAETIARTESHRAREMGNLAATVEAAEMGIKFRRRWLATLDSNTRDTHGAMDGQEIEVFDEKGEIAKFQSPSGGEAEYPGGFGIASEDINCRCTMVEVVEGFEPTDRRFKGEGIREYQSYNDWINKK